jgi:Zn-dependent peptidase ImmA (M78 family)
MTYNIPQIEQIAASLLLQQEFTCIKDFSKLNVLKLKFDKQIIFYPMQQYCKECSVDISAFKNDKFVDGCFIRRKYANLILYDETIKSKERINWTLAHEVGHIYLNHKKETYGEDIEANSFAAALLMPSVLLSQIQKKVNRPLDDGDILGTFNVSYEAAMYRIENFESMKNYEISMVEYILMLSLLEPTKKEKRTSVDKLREKWLDPDDDNFTRLF